MVGLREAPFAAVGPFSERLIKEVVPETRSRRKMSTVIMIVGHEIARAAFESYELSVGADSGVKRIAVTAAIT